MQGGLVEQYDTPQVIYDTPANLYVAGFMGSPPMNLLKGTLTSSTTVQVGEHSITLLAPPNGVEAYVGKDVILGLRPEHITDAQRAANEAQQTITVPVRIAEPTGADTLVTIEFGQVKALQTALARVHPQAYEAGQSTITLTLDTRKAVLFDVESTLRIA
jgi:multiple sugar transport system ATP-binding protein